MQHHFGSYRVEFYLATYVKKIATIVDQRSFEAPLPQGARSPVGDIDVAHITASEALHHPRQPCNGSWRHQEVYVVGHQDIGMDSNVVLLS